MCGKFTSNAHLAGSCLSMSGLRLPDRHNGRLTPLLTQLEQTNGVRWETINVDFGKRNPVKSFTDDTFREPLPHLDFPCSQYHHMPT
jgi:hypothetical protein